MMDYTLLFFVYSFLGWILDTAYRSMHAQHYVSGSFLPFLTPIYGLGGILLTAFFHASPFSILIDTLFGTFLVTVVELAGGIFCVHILQKRYWDYSKDWTNFQGHISVRQSLYWLFLVFIFRVLFPFLPL